ncbi:MAG: hypothetical protein IPJ84_17165 [Bdellovibrionales bacterium]|nr:hypothetical protein [Bdellovibrionales bacterium]
MTSNQKNRKAEVIKPVGPTNELPPLPARLSDATIGRFFLIVSPGFEADAERELRGHLAGTGFEETVKKEKGGVSFEAALGTVLQIQPKLKVVTRVLLRIAVFGAKDFPKLHRKIQGLPWKTWLKPGVTIRARAASHRSRLRIKKRIEIVAAEAAAEALGVPYQEEPSGPAVLCLLRLDDDVATVSLDLSGELLHKRGDREDVGKAPLRESFAAAVVERSLEHLSAAGKTFEWLEPMAGTGVFLHEYLRGQGLLAESDAAKRTFAGVELLAVQSSRKVEPNVTPPQIVSEPKLKLFTRYTLIETHAEQRARASELAPKGLPIQVLASASAWASGDEPRFVVVNPPWGKRLKAGATDTTSRQEEFLLGLETQFMPAFVACVMPALGRRPRLPKGWEQAASVRFRAGGVLVAASFFRVRSRLGENKALPLQSVDKKD